MNLTVHSQREDGSPQHSFVEARPSANYFTPLTMSGFSLPVLEKEPVLLASHGGNLCLLNEGL